MAELLFPLTDRIIATSPTFTRALRPQAILELSIHGEAITAATIFDATQLARLAPPNAAVFFTGSLFPVGEARAMPCGAVS